MNRIENYIDSIVPKNLSKKKKQLIRDEIGTHIYERVDFYKEIGYDENASVEKALADMGEDEEVKLSIRNEFEELHAERTWWAVAVALAVFTMNMLCFFTETWLFSADSIGHPEPSRVLISFVMVFAVILMAILFYRKGFRKSLIGLGISQVLITATLLMMFYPQCAIYGIIIDISYLLDKFTPLVLSDVAVYGIDSVILYGTPIYLLLVAIICFILSLKIKKHGKPKRKTPTGIILFCVIYFVIAIPVAFLTEPAEKYFDDYPKWFNVNTDSISSKTEMFFHQFDGNMSYDEASDLLRCYGYMTIDDYEKTLDKNTAEIFRGSFEKLDFFFDEEYIIWFNPDDLKNPYDNYGGNGFVYLLKGEDNRIKSKGVGNAFEDVFTMGGKFTCLIKYCVLDFKNIKVGDSESDIVSKFGNDHGVVYSKFATYTAHGTETYYRFYCNSKHHDFSVLPGTSFFKDSCEVYIEFTFLNGKVTDGKLNYHDYDVGQDVYLTISE